MTRRVLHLLTAATVCLVLLAESAHAQRADTTARTRVDLQADSLVGAREDGEAVRRLFGNVRLQQDETWLWARRATQYVERDEILFTGNVRIVERGDSLWADRVLYDSRTKVGRATGSVHLTDGEVDVYAPSARYFTDEKRATFEDGVRLVDSLTVLTSEAGTYLSDEKRADFVVDVRLEDPQSLMLADSVTYYREREVAHAFGDVGIERLGDAERDSTTRTFVFGQEVYNDESAGYSRVRGRPLLMQLRTDTTDVGIAEMDTLLLRAVELETVRDDSLRRLVAIDSVRLWQTDLAALADSAVFDRIDLQGDSTREELLLYQDPMAWFDDAQIHADTLHLKGRDGSVDTLFARTDAFLARLDTSLQRIQQLKGRSITGRFEQDTLRHLTARPNAESIYFMGGDDGASDGAVRVSGDRIDFTFRGGELHRLRVLDGIEGTRFPEDDIPEPFELEGYRWVPERKPQKAALLEALPPRRLEMLPEEPAAPPEVAPDTVDVAQNE